MDLRTICNMRNHRADVCLSTQGSRNYVRPRMDCSLYNMNYIHNLKPRCRSGNRSGEDVQYQSTLSLCVCSSRRGCRLRSLIYTVFRRYITWSRNPNSHKRCNGDALHRNIKGLFFYVRSSRLWPKLSNLQTRFLRSLYFLCDPDSNLYLRSVLTIREKCSFHQSSKTCAHRRVYADDRVHRNPDNSAMGLLYM